MNNGEPIMKRINYTLKAIFILSAGLFLLEGCNIDVERIGRKGSEVSFRASTYSGVNPKTKTDYSGDVTGGIERIDWLIGDKIRIYSDKAAQRNDAALHFADYQITSATENGYRSEATIADYKEPGSTASGLVWGSGEHSFFSIYPSPLTNGDIDDSSSASYNELAFAIPNVQTYSVDPADPTKLTPDMDYAYMCAAVKASSGETVNLSFKPMFTAFQITVDSKDDPTLVLRKFSLISETMEPAGSVYVTATPSANSSESTFAYGLPDGIAENRSVSVSFGSEGVTITKGHPVTFTVFARPQEYDDLSVRFETSAGNRTFALSYSDGTGVQFDPDIKYNLGRGAIPGSRMFKTITVNLSVKPWEKPALDEDDSAQLPQSSQFVVTGVQNVYQLHNTAEGKALRQTWVLRANTATVTFDIFSPVHGTYEIVPQGATDKFTVAFTEGGLTGTIADPRVPGESKTKVTFTVTPSGAAAGDRIWFKIYATSASGIRYNLDSEVQLFDTRGFHYFRIDDPLD